MFPFNLLCNPARRDAEAALASRVHTQRIRLTNFLEMHSLRLFLIALQLAGGAALRTGAACPPLERQAMRGSRAAVVCGLFDAMGGETAWSKCPSSRSSCGHPPL